MRFPFRLAALPLLFLLTGCPLKSKYSLGDSHSARMDQGLMGKWVDASPEKSAKGTLSIFRFNENEYYIEAIDHETQKTDRYRGYLTSIDNVPILNIQEIMEKQSPMEFLFVKVSLSPEKILMLYIIEDSLLSGRSLSSRNDLLSYIRTNINNPKLYDNAIILRREVR
jgi:hypothetical protein